MYTKGRVSAALQGVANARDWVLIAFQVNVRLGCGQRLVAGSSPPCSSFS